MRYRKTQINDYHQSLKELIDFINQFPKKEYMNNYKECEIFLQRTQWFLDLLGNPERAIPHYIHITGTSGKGSTTQMVHEILLAAGKSVGSTYSPHPTTAIERIRVNKKFISLIAFTRLVKTMRRALTIAAKISPFGMVSFFEVMFAMTVLHFAQKKVQYAVIEVGLGGRFSASNTIPTPDVTIITNVGLDHTDLLGKTKTKIAWEKAGIIKSGTHFISAEKTKAVRAVFAKEMKKHKPKTIHYVSAPSNIILSELGTEFTYQRQQYSMPIIGAHQASNATLAIEAAHALRLSKIATQKGLATVSRPTCFEVIYDTPLVIVDGAHNPDKMRSTRDALVAIRKHRKDTRVHLVIGIAENKDLLRIIRTIAPHATAIYTTRFTKNTYRKSAQPHMLATLAKQYCADVKQYAQPQQALARARNRAHPQDIVLITGSVFLAGELRTHWISEQDILENRAANPYTI